MTGMSHIRFPTPVQAGSGSKGALSGPDYYQATPSERL